uniref:Uncharacterized protein n=1 Tax=Arundo donax TaxID=35708 RepID=A0A0A9B419_ARUDO
MVALPQEWCSVAGACGG